METISSSLPTMACSHQGDVVVFEVNAIGWAPSGARTALSLHHELDPARLPAAKGVAAIGHERTPSGRYVLAAGRADEDDGLCQAITPGALKPRVTYRVAGWVSVAAAAPGAGVGGTTTHHPVHVSIRVDGGAVACSAASDSESEAGTGGSRWAEIKGAFRLKESPRSAVVYVHGAPAGVDVKVMDLRIIATDRKARFSYLKEKTDKVRKRDVVVKVDGAPAGAPVRVVQLDSAFPIGSCINGTVIQDPAFVDFFTNHMDWAVFENELKWYWTEAQRGQLNYADADRLLDFCDRAGKPVRGHCIFWAVDGDVQQWIKDIADHDEPDQLMAAVQARLNGLLARYAGRFPHYDVNNEMLHGRFFRDRLGDDVAALMFREAARLDPGAALFVNDYNVECGNDANATPERYVELIRDLQRRGAQVGGVGLQGHVTHPVGEVICDALDTLAAATDLPIWFTELDVCEPDDALRADDLEVVMREAYAHPAVQGVVLWGFMQGHMWRQDAALVNTDGTVNDAGQRFIDLRREWTSDARGCLDADGQFKFRGFHGSYVAQVTTATGTKMLKAFTVDKGDTPLVLDVDN
ncbi:endo-1,4-beta-xylanase 1-like isoform X1 [Miscanthus floridulus]|uniref:endo-1,4-beta-xylanase 1-like isoform X1 n=1 Tax=Miscanthus floridulus TaxID=154761 RepID=UPI0034581BDF